MYVIISYFFVIIRREKGRNKEIEKKKTRNIIVSIFQAEVIYILAKKEELIRNCYCYFTFF